MPTDNMPTEITAYIASFLKNDQTALDALSLTSKKNRKARLLLILEDEKKLLATLEKQYAELKDKINQAIIAYAKGKSKEDGEAVEAIIRDKNTSDQNKAKFRKLKDEAAKATDEQRKRLKATIQFQTETKNAFEAFINKYG